MNGYIYNLYYNLWFMKHIPMFQWIIETSTPDGPKLWECMGYHGDVIGWYRIRRIHRYITTVGGRLSQTCGFTANLDANFVFGVPNLVKQSLFLLTRDQFRRAIFWLDRSPHKQSVQMAGRLIFQIIIWRFLKCRYPKPSIEIGCSMINYPFWRTPIVGNLHFSTQQMDTVNSIGLLEGTGRRKQLSIDRSKIFKNNVGPIFGSKSTWWFLGEAGGV